MLTPMLSNVYLPDVDARCVSVHNVLEDLQEVRQCLLAVLTP